MVKPIKDVFKLNRPNAKDEIKAIAIRWMVIVFAIIVIAALSGRL